MIPRFKPWLNYREAIAAFRGKKGAVVCFEKEFAKAFETREAIAFSYGRSALWAFLKAVGVKDAEVLMPAYTCSVVAHAVSLSGNMPCFVDINLSDFNMDLDLLTQAINEKTRAIVATHLFGFPLDLDRLEDIVTEAEKRFGHKIWLIQDCAHSFGARWRGRLVGSSGDVAIYGLNVSKMITSIFGGMLTVNDPDLAAKIRSWRDSHFKKAPWKKAWLRRLYLGTFFLAFSRPIYSFTHWLQEKTSFLNRFTKSYHLDDRIHFPPDYLELLTDVEGGVGLVQLEKYPEIVSLRRKNAAWLINNVKWPEGWLPPPLVEGATYSHFVVRVPERQVELEFFAKNGIQLGELIQYSVPGLTCYEMLEGEFEKSEVASNTTINVPINPDLKVKDLKKIRDIINKK